MAELYAKLAERIRNAEPGQGLVEYALILVLIAVVSIVILGLLGAEVSNVLSIVTSAMQGAGS